MSGSPRCSIALLASNWRLVDDQPGVTRDRKEAEGRLADLPLDPDRYGRVRGRQR